MTYRNFNGLPRSARTVMIACVAAVALGVLWPAGHALAQNPPDRDDLDVTLQILVDPAARTPDEVVRRIPLPAHKAAESKSAEQKEDRKSDAADKGQERAREARERAREMSDNAKDTGEQREQARRSVTEHGRPNPKPPDPPGPPARPPRT